MTWNIILTGRAVEQPFTKVMPRKTWRRRFRPWDCTWWRVWGPRERSDTGGRDRRTQWRCRRDRIQNPDRRPPVKGHGTFRRHSPTDPGVSTVLRADATMCDIMPVTLMRSLWRCCAVFHLSGKEISTIYEPFNWGRGDQYRRKILTDLFFILEKFNFSTQLSWCAKKRICFMPRRMETFNLLKRVHLPRFRATFGECHDFCLLALVFN